MPQYLIYSIIGIFLAGVFNILSNTFTQKSKNQVAFSFIFNVISASLVLILTIIFTRSIPLPIIPRNKLLLLIPLITALLYGLTEKLRFFVAKQIPPSSVQILGSLQYIVSIPLAYFLYNDSTISIYKTIGILLILSANFLLNYNAPKQHVKKKTFKKIYFLAILMTIFYGTAGALDKLGSTTVGISFYNLWVWLAPLPIIGLLPTIKIKQIMQEIKNVAIFKFIILATFNITFYWLYLLALKTGPSVNVIILFSLTNIITFILESVWLKNYIRNKKLQLLLVLISTTGVILVVR